MKLRIATRRSPLALAQTRWVAERIRAASPGIEIEEVQLVTQGDRVLDVPLAKVGGKGLFVTEVEQALEDGRADIAVHSMKDVPEKLAAGMELICVPEREDPHDVVITKSGEGFFDLAAGTRVGTSSLRRAVQLHAARNDVAFAVLRGNVGTRLRKLDDGEYGAIVLANAGLRRLGLAQDRKLEVLSVEHSIPAVGQGALGIEGRADDARSRALLATLEHGPTRVAVEAERAFLVALHGSCTTPLAAHARIEGGSLQIDAMVGAIDGSHVVRGGMHDWVDVTATEQAIAKAREMGRALADSLLEQGARALIDEARASSDPYVHLYSKPN
ncbi:hydroxymethylbilane synthase [Sandaracinus amylolyticus]|uniref:Porphobilinogen deaminase n=1 Tax=Sandaracinus amylolyticus TaxID=927083 RepID=A0A0F6YL16_9BACT|nr:hydroxymethylbilane synthase [Sandaracinus amylolyticus]AKF09028.1 Porphobilinogen deaminase [Sandaracinus amylolyticus]